LINSPGKTPVPAGGNETCTIKICFQAIEMVKVAGPEAVPDRNAAGVLLPDGKRIGADQDGRVQGTGSIDQGPSHHIREPKEKLEHGFFVRNGGDCQPETGKEKGPMKLTDPLVISGT
jgi:hypothetical protein